MLTREILSEEHAALGALADGILVQLDADRPDIDALVSLRWRLTRLLFVHLAKEDKHLYPPLRGHESPAVRKLSARFVAEMGDLAASLTHYVQDWPIERALGDWSGFGVSTRDVLHALRQRIDREETELYPLLVEARASAG